jgi:hypothetical protein
VIGISPNVALALLLALGFLLLAMIGLSYLFLGALPSSPSGNPQLFPLEQQTPPSSHCEIPSKANRVIYAVLTGVVWFFLWVLFANVMGNILGEGASLHLARAFGYATASLAGSFAAIWCGVWLWKRYRHN